VDARMLRDTETIRDQRVREWPGRAVALTGLMQKAIEQEGRCPSGALWGG
jgi:hypothetical protein